MKRYKLLRDLPYFKAGTIFTNYKGNWKNENGWLPESMSELFNTWHENSDFFEPIDDKPTRWRAQVNGLYWYAHGDWLEASYTNDSGSDTHDARYEGGNYFQTKEQAQAVADAIKELLVLVHLDLKSGEGDMNLGKYPPRLLHQLIEIAHKLLSKERDNG